MIYNFTQHSTSKEQLKDGICNVPDMKKVSNLLTFDEKPSPEEINDRAKKLVQYALELNAKEVMIGGAFYLMVPLVQELLNHGIIPYYAFSKRESVEVCQKDGSIVKKAVFRYEGLIKATLN